MDSPTNGQQGKILDLTKDLLMAVQLMAKEYKPKDRDSKVEKAYSELGRRSEEEKESDGQKIAKLKM